MNELEDLRDRVAELEHVLGLTSTFPVSIVPNGIRCRAQCEALLGLLLERTVITAEAAHIAVYGDRVEADQPSLKAVSVLLFWLRKGLRQHSVTLRNVYGAGRWYLDDIDKAKLRSLIEAEKAEA